ncbi:MAG: dockerin type I domain-containing protein [Dehalococcoidia bacterium]
MPAWTCIRCVHHEHRGTLLSGGRYYKGVSLDVIDPGSIPGLSIDVNGSRQVNAVDSLCILRAVDQLSATSQCPASLPYSDVNQDGTSTNVDALCVLRYVAAFAGNINCPDASTQAPPGASPFNAPTSPGSGTGAGPLDASSVQVFLTPTSVTTTSGSSATFTLQVTIPAGVSLGAWTIDINYTGTDFPATGCTGSNGSDCNANFDPTLTRFDGSTSTGLTGTVTLGTVTLLGNGLAPRGYNFFVFPRFRELADTTGNPLTTTFPRSYITTQ